MSDADRAYARLVVANPWPETTALPGDLDVFPTRIEEEAMGVQGLEEVQQPKNRSGWLIGAAAAALVLAGFGVAALLNSQTDTAGEPETPVEVVEAFFAAWNEDDLDTALNYVAAEEQTELAEILESTTAVGFTVEADCVEGNSPGAVLCSIIKRGPIHDAYYASLGAEPRVWNLAQFVSGGSIVILNLPELEGAGDSFEGYVRGIDQAAFLERCEPSGLWLSSTCGEWLAQYVDGYVAFVESS